MNRSLGLDRPKMNKKALMTIISTTIAIVFPGRLNGYGLIGEYLNPETEDAGRGAVPAIELLAGSTST